jgi:diguanylate cyclase (GGDEF)-like protein/PAS domain S-box-containing protein
LSSVLTSDPSSAGDSAASRRASRGSEPPAGTAPWSREAAFDALFDNAAEGLLVCDAQGQVLACNALAAAMLGVTAAQAIGRPAAAWLEQEGSRTRRPLGLVAGEACAARGDVPERRLDLRVTPVRGADAARWIVHLRDLGEHQRTKRKLAQLANYDSLTGLPNRSLFRDRLAQAMQRAQRHNQPMALMFLDLDRFKLVNDGLGHHAGDQLLCHVARTLTGCLRASDSVLRADEGAGLTLSRLGGDEFTVIAEAIGGPEDAAHVAQRMLDALNAPLVIGTQEVVISASIGISMYPTDDVDLDGLIRHADLAMYRSKSLGRSTYSFFSDDLKAATAARVSLEGSLRRAIEQHEFQLHYQPKADLATGRVVGVEALLRWHRPGHGLVSPDRFIGVLEDTGLILPVGAWVLRAACAQLAEWDSAGLPPLTLSVNLSARQLRHLHLRSLVQETLRENDLDPRRLEFELTESQLMEDTEANRTLLEAFREMGVGLAIDDFGTGHSSLAYLKRFDIDTIKIDRSFVQSLPDSAEDLAIASAVVALGRSMQMRVVAEGVETEAQAAVLQSMGCDQIQGYLLSPALGGQEFVAWLAEFRRERDSGPGDFGPVRETAPITLFSLLDTP